MKQFFMYLSVLLIGYGLLAGPVLARPEVVEQRPLKTAVHDTDPARPYWSKVLPEEVVATPDGS